MDGVGEAPRLLARAMYVLEAQMASLLKGILPCRHAACHHNHIALLAVLDPAEHASTMELNRRRPQSRWVAAATVSTLRARNQSGCRCRVRRGRTSRRHCAAEFSVRLEWPA